MELLIPSRSFSLPTKPQARHPYLPLTIPTIFVISAALTPLPRATVTLPNLKLATDAINEISFSNGEFINICFSTVFLKKQIYYSDNSIVKLFSSSEETVTLKLYFSDSGMSSPESIKLKTFSGL